MSALYFEVLTDAEKKEFPKLAHFAKVGILAGGTILALQIKHRRSYDFDIFCSEAIPKTIARKSREIFGRITIINRFEEEFTFTTPLGVKITFIYYPFHQLYSHISTSAIPLFHWKDIALDKAYTIGRRAQYRDYVDLFFLMREKKLTLGWIIKNALKKFGSEFPEKLFLRQLVYFEDLKILPLEFLREKYEMKEIKPFFEKVVEDYTKSKIK